jgi:hypothetical protein
MRLLNTVAWGFAFVAGVHLSAGAGAACVTNELDVESQVQLGEHWNEIINGGESKCDEGKGGLVSVWVAQTPGPDTDVEADQGGYPDATGEVSADGAVRLEKGDVDNFLVIYDGSGNEVSRQVIAGMEDDM